MKGRATSIFDRLRSWWRGGPPVITEPALPPPLGRTRGAVDHVIILDGTMSTLAPGEEGNCGLLFKLLTQNGVSSTRTVYYEPGLQWQGWGNLANVALGRGINQQIRRAYGWLASHYREGDRIFLFGYSRGAFAARSLAGVIDRVGLLRRDEATERAVRLAYRHYQQGPDSPIAQAFSVAYCHRAAPIQMVGVWDTVKALGLRVPFFWMISRREHGFHSPQLGKSVQYGFQALALDETRSVFEPVIWEVPEGMENRVEQCWFRGAHGDIGGNIGQFAACRPLANIPLVWMLEKAEFAGLALPDAWQSRFACNANAPMVGTWRGFGAVFLIRRRRRILQDRSEVLHPSVPVNLASWYAAQMPQSRVPKPPVAD